MDLPILVRPGTDPDDKAFFFNATLLAYRQLSSIARLVPERIYFREHKKVLERLLARPGAELLIACEAGDPKFITGFLLCEPAHRIIHFVYVKRSLRRFGIMTALIRNANIALDKATFSHWTTDMALIMAKKIQHPKRPKLNPYLFCSKEGAA